MGAWKGVACAAALLWMGAPEAGHACSICQAGDPTYSSFGATAQQEGSVSAFLQMSGWKKRSGVLPDEGGAPAPAQAAPASNAEEHNQGERLDLYLSWTPLDRLTLTMDLPFGFNTIVEQDGADRTHSTLGGFGDVSLSASGVLWRSRDILPDTWVEGRLLLKTPTGADSQEVDGVRDPHLQLGTGSWDWGAGLAATHRTAWGALYGSVFYRGNGPGALHYTHGDVLLANAAVQVPLGHSLGVPALEPVTVGLELNFRYAGYDHHRGERYLDSGGSMLFATPSVRLRLPFGLRETKASLRMAVQLPLTQDWLHGFQREEAVWSVGLLLPF